MFNYKAFDVNSIGYSHLHSEKKKPMQDCSISLNSSDHAVALISDGHGSAPYLRSDRGSKLAVETASQVLESVYIKYKSFDGMSEAQIGAIKKEISEQLGSQWIKAVTEDYEKDPISEAELLSFKDDILANPSVDTQNRWKRYYTGYKKGTSVLKAYGCTLIGLLICEGYCLGVHVGDGKCVAVYEDASCDKPIPWDEACIANICTSMCDEELRCRVQIFPKRPIAAFVASDGLDDTFGDGGKLDNFYRKVCYNIIQKGESYIEDLQASLPILSEKGSKDDMSIAGVYDMEKLRESEQFILAQVELENLFEKVNKLNNDLNNVNYRLSLNEKSMKRSREVLRDKEKTSKQLAGRFGGMARTISGIDPNKLREQTDQRIQELTERIEAFRNDPYSRDEVNRMLRQRKELYTQKNKQDSLFDSIGAAEGERESAQKDLEVQIKAYNQTLEQITAIKNDIRQAKADIEKKQSEIKQMKRERAAKLGEPDPYPTEDTIVVPQDCDEDIIILPSAEEVLEEIDRTENGGVQEDTDTAATVSDSISENISENDIPPVVIPQDMDYDGVFADNVPIEKDKVELEFEVTDDSAEDTDGAEDSAGASDDSILSFEDDTFEHTISEQEAKNYGCGWRPIISEDKKADDSVSADDAKENKPNKKIIIEGDDD